VEGGLAINENGYGPDHPAESRQTSTTSPYCEGKGYDKGHYHTFRVMLRGAIAVPILWGDLAKMSQAVRL
jgi:hypothetical protein